LVEAGTAKGRQHGNSTAKAQQQQRWRWWSRWRRRRHGEGTAKAQRHGSSTAAARRRHRIGGSASSVLRTRTTTTVICSTVICNGLHHHGWGRVQAGKRTRLVGRQGAPAWQHSTSQLRTGTHLAQHVTPASATTVVRADRSACGGHRRPLSARHPQPSRASRLTRQLVTVVCPSGRAGTTFRRHLEGAGAACGSSTERSATRALLFTF
jgi:hypothetical protein